MDYFASTLQARHFQAGHFSGQNVLLGGKIGRNRGRSGWWRRRPTRGRRPTSEPREDQQLGREDVLDQARVPDGPGQGAGLEQGLPEFGSHQEQTFPSRKSGQVRYNAKQKKS